MSDPTRVDEAAGLEHVTATLRALPAAHSAAIDRVVAAALDRQRRARQRVVWALRAATIVLAVGLTAGGVWYGRRSARPTTVAAAPAVDPFEDRSGFVDRGHTGAYVSRASTGGASESVSADDAPISVTFALHRPGARRVAVVGDFDDWSPTAEPMRRGAGDTWMTTVQITPGRHGYAFVVDDTVWVTDPRASIVSDPDYGRDHSVLVVGQP